MPVGDGLEKQVCYRHGEKNELIVMQNQSNVCLISVAETIKLV